MEIRGEKSESFGQEFVRVLLVIEKRIRRLITFATFVRIIPTTITFFAIKTGFNRKRRVRIRVVETGTPLRGAPRGVLHFRDKSSQKRVDFKR